MSEVKDVWELCEDPPAGCDDVADLYHWSTNYDAAQGPFTLLLDIVGWSDEQLGERLYSGSYPVGYLEAGKLAKALTQWADRPHDVNAFIEELMEAESRG